MKKILQFFKTHGSVIAASAAVTLTAILTAFRYRASLIRTGQAIKDLGLSIAYYFMAFFDKEIKVSVTEFTDFDILKYLPYNFDELLRRLRDMWGLIFNKQCFATYIIKIAAFANTGALILMLFLPTLLIGAVLFKMVCLTPNQNIHGSKSKALMKFERKTLPWLLRWKERIREFFSTLFGYKRFSIPFVLLWLLNLNILTIAIEAFAYYFYFAMSIDILNLLVQLAKLILDLVIMLSGAPMIFWLCLAYAILCKVRENIGYKRLNVRETANRQFIISQPIVTMFCGTMGTGKTKTLTDVAISTEIILREKAFEKILEIDTKYPNFPWQLFEDQILRMLEAHMIYNLTTIREWMAIRKARYYRTPDKDKPYELFGYQYRTEINDNLTVRDLWDDLTNYACLYFIYIIQSSLLVSNYSVRVDNVINHAGNFPLWQSNLFRSDPRLADSISRHAHILDYDTLRLGQQMLADNPRRGSFEFGVILMSEIGKERGNSITLQEMKRKDEQTNQKNDLFSYAIKMCRHKATIDNYPFVRFLCDEQRPESLGADMRDLLNIVHIREKGEIKLMMPFFFVSEILHGFFYPKWQNFYTEYRYNRGDHCLPVYLMHNAMSAFHNYYIRKYNAFGVAELTVEVERGTQDGERSPEKYFLCSKKIYSNRFSTDCYRGYFEEQLKKTAYGLDDYAEYMDTVATAEELHYQNSYFINDMEKIKDQGEKQ